MSCDTDQIVDFYPGESRNAALAYHGALKASESVVEALSVEVEEVYGRGEASHLTFGDPFVNTVAFTLDGQTVAVGQAVQFLLTTSDDAVRGTIYKLRIATKTTTNPKHIEEVLLRII